MMKRKYNGVLSLLLVFLFGGAPCLVYGQKPLKKPTLAAKVKKLQPRIPQSPSRKSVSKYSFVNGHEFVDLGLSVKWATCNVGANRPEEYGDYFAWGEIDPKSEYVAGNSSTYKKKMSSITGNSRYDAATAKWGVPVRMPTKKEFEELQSHCWTTWTTRNGVRGRLVTSKKNGKSIFLPAAGRQNGMSFDKVGECGYYWSSTPNEDYLYYAYSLLFNSGYFGWNWSSRYNGFSVRPVRE